MNVSRLYIIIGLVLVAVVVVVLLLPDGEPAQQTAEQTQMPPGHPDIDGMEDMPGAGQPGAGNVRSEFMEEFKRLGEKIAAQDESDTSDVLVYARMLLDAHQAKKSLPLFERYHEAAPKNIPVMLDLSVAYFETDRKDKAEEITREVLRLDPENTTARYNLGALYAATDQPEKAKEIWNELIMKHPDSPDAARAEELMKRL